MPHIRIRGLASQTVQSFSQGIGDELAPLLSTSPANFTVEAVASQFFTNGHPDPGYPFVEVLWFERTDEVKQNCARHITERVKELTGAQDVAVVFVPLKPKDYFENGQHF